MLTPLTSKNFTRQKWLKLTWNAILAILSHFWGVKIFEVRGVNTADAPCTCNMFCANPNGSKWVKIKMCKNFADSKLPIKKANFSKFQINLENTCHWFGQKNIACLYNNIYLLLLLLPIVRISRITHFSAFSGEELRRLPMESVDSVAEEPVSSTLKLALSAISVRRKNKERRVSDCFVVMIF